MMLKYISGLKDLFEVQPQFFVSTDAKTKAVTAGLLGKRLFIVEKAGVDNSGAAGMSYVDALNVAAVNGPIEIDDTTLRFKYPDGSPVLTSEEVAAVGAPQRDLEKFTAGFGSLVPNSQPFHIPTTIKGLRVPGEEAWALINISKGKLHMRVAPSIADLDNAQEVPVAECGTVDGEHMFPVPLALIKKPLELNDKVAYSFAQDEDGTYYFIARTEDAKCVYSCMAYNVETSGAPENQEEEVIDVEESVAEEAVEEPAAETPAEEAAESGEPEEVPEEAPEPVEQIAGPCEAAPDDGGDSDETDGDAGSPAGDGDSVGDGSDSVGTDTEAGEPVKAAASDDYPLMETLDNDLKEFGRRLKTVVNAELAEFERKRKNIAKQVRPLAKKVESTPATEDLKKKLAAVESERDAAQKKLGSIKQELAPYKDLLKINWKLLD